MTENITRRERRRRNMAESATNVDVLEHMGLVRSIAVSMGRNYPRHVDIEDLVQAGMVGLMEAAQRFDPEHGVPFAELAPRRIRGAINDSVRESAWMTRGARAKYKEIRTVEERLAAEGDLTNRRVAEEMGATEESLKQFRSDMAMREVVTMDNNQGASISDSLQATDATPEEVAASNDMVERLATAIATLPARYRSVLDGYYSQGMTTVEIAAALGVNRSRVSAILQSAHRRLAEHLGVEPAAVSRVESQHDGSIGSVVDLRALIASAEFAVGGNSSTFLRVG
ncbi:MAG: sigma-70 family RNA polymerase sigma factor [Ilumatobacter sp.]